jgi:rfaE bifunctional protein nucleotidyltransferase chain/domain/rfaE bifunctional protein kinase chain/domain
MSRLVVVGDALLDRDLDGRAERLAPDAPVPVVDALEPHDRAGGAGLAAAIAAASHDVTLVCALGDDDAGRRVRRLLTDAGVAVCDLQLRGTTPEKVRVRAGGRAIVRLDAGGERRECGPLTAAARAALAEADAVLVSDYGRGVAAEPTVREALAALRSTPVVWDPHPLGPAPVPDCALVTPNAAEAERAAPGAVARDDRPPSGALPVAVGGLALHEARARALRERWRAIEVCVTLGSAGALLVGAAGPALAVAAPPAGATDPCGAGDCFAATAAAQLAAGAPSAQAVRAAVTAASAFVAAGGAAGWAAGSDAPRREPDAAGLAARVRAQGGTVVASGGCFDLLHAGHVRTLEAARALGDCLVVCLNSDASVRRLKGAGRPVVRQDDRAAVLAALRCVDAVAVFDEDDPRAVLRDVRPHVWVKGGDYEAAELPEAETLAAWGGRAVIVPHIDGHSTTHLIANARNGIEEVPHAG